MNDPMPWWGTVALALSFAALGVTVALAFAFAGRCDGLQQQIADLRDRFNELVDDRIRPASYLPELWATDDEP